MLAPLPLHTVPDSAVADGAPIQESPIAVVDSAAAQASTAEQQPEGIERVMLAEDKLPVVLTVVLIVWAGILLVLWRTERRLARIEDRLRALGAEGRPGRSARRDPTEASSDPLS